MATIHFLSAYSSCSHYHHILATRYLTDDSFCFLFSIAEIFGLDITRYNKRILHIAHHFRMLLSTAKIIIYFELCKLHNANCIIHIDFSYYRGKVSFKSYNFPSKYITIFHTPTSFESNDKNKGDWETETPYFLLSIRNKTYSCTTIDFPPRHHPVKIHTIIWLPVHFSIFFIFTIFSKKTEASENTRTSAKLM